MADDFALIVGINDYPNFRPLNGAINDAEDFRDWVLAKDGGNVDPQNCRFIPSSGNPLKPVQDDVDAALLEFKNQLGAGKGRRFYFYFSGHGVGETYNDTAACLGKWSNDYRRAGLDVPKYAELIAQSGKFPEIAVFLDCCRVRLINAGGLKPMLDWVRPAEDAGVTRMFRAYATEFQSLAYEAAIATGDLNTYRGHFTRALLAGLRGGAAVASGGVPASRLKTYLEKWTPILAKEHDQDQKPQVENGFDGIQDPIFGAAKPEWNVRITFKPERHGDMIVEDGDLNIVRQGDAATGPWQVPVRPGLAVVRDAGTGEEKPFRILPGKEAVDVLF